jgi:hypothetical protein
LCHEKTNYNGYITLKLKLGNSHVTCSNITTTTLQRHRPLDANHTKRYLENIKLQTSEITKQKNKIQQPQTALIGGKQTYKILAEQNVN